MDRLSQLEESVAELSGALCNALGIVQQEAEGREQRASSAACEEAEGDEVEAWKRGPMEWGNFVAKQAQVVRDLAETLRPVCVPEEEIVSMILQEQVQCARAKECLHGAVEDTEHVMDHMREILRMCCHDTLME